MVLTVADILVGRLWAGGLLPVMNYDMYDLHHDFRVGSAWTDPCTQLVFTGWGDISSIRFILTYPLTSTHKYGVYMEKKVKTEALRSKQPSNLYVPYVIYCTVPMDRYPSYIVEACLT